MHARMHARMCRNSRPKCAPYAGKGIPNERVASARTRRLPFEIIPDDAHITTSQFVDVGGHLTLESHFGNDPLAGRDGIIAERNRQFHQQYPHSCPQYFMLS